MAVDADIPGMHADGPVNLMMQLGNPDLHLRRSLMWILLAADFDLLGELDLVTTGALPSVECLNAGAHGEQQQQQLQQLQQLTPMVRQQRPTIRLQSLAVNAIKAAPASLSSSSISPRGCLPLLSRDLNGDLTCHGDGMAADARQVPPPVQQTALRAAGFKVPRRQPPTERPVHRLQAASFPHAQQSSSIAPDGTNERLSNVSGAGIKGTHTPAPARRQSSSNSEDIQHAAGTDAVTGSIAAAAAQPSEATPLQPPEQRRPSGVEVAKNECRV